MTHSVWWNQWLLRAILLDWLSKSTETIRSSSCSLMKHKYISRTIQLSKRSRDTFSISLTETLKLALQLSMEFSGESEFHILKKRMMGAVEILQISLSHAVTISTKFGNICMIKFKKETQGASIVCSHSRSFDWGNKFLIPIAHGALEMLIVPVKAGLFNDKMARKLINLPTRSH